MKIETFTEKAGKYTLSIKNGFNFQGSKKFLFHNKLDFKDFVAKI